MGVDPESFADEIEAEQEAAIPFEVLAENWSSVKVFLSCATQWRKLIPPMGGALIYEGLHYSGVRDVIWSHGHDGEKARMIFADVQVMERAAIDAFNDRADK